MARQIFNRFFLIGVLLFTSACGGSSGGGGSTPPSLFTPTRHLPTHRDTPVATAVTPGITPTPTATPVGDTIIVPRGGNIADAIAQAPSGGTVVVSPGGTYGAFTLGSASRQVPLTIIADTTGALTGLPAGDVTIRAGDFRSGIELFEQRDVIIDGFTVIGGEVSGILVVDSQNITIRNCTISNGGGDGLLFEVTQESLVFNNIIANNVSTGIGAFGSQSIRVINNTIYGNNNAGVAVGGVFIDDTTVRPSSNFTLRNNVIDANSPGGVFIESDPPTSLIGYSGDYNLNADGYAGPSAGANDFNSPPLFRNPNAGNFRVSANSPVIDAGDPGTSSDLLSILRTRSVRTDNVPDTGRVDLGYHYPGANAAVPTATNTSVIVPTRPAPSTPTPVFTATSPVGSTPPVPPTPTRTQVTENTPTATPTRTPLVFASRTPIPTRTPVPTRTPAPTRTIPPPPPTRTSPPTLTPVPTFTPAN